MTPLPAGLRLALDPGVRRWASGAISGGTPRRLLRLSGAGAEALDDLERGAGTGEAARVLGRRLVNAGLAHPRPAPRTVSADVTVVVAVRDRPIELDRCLRALHGGPPVVVVDDGSREPDSVARVAERHGARLLRRPVSGGPAAARNAGLRVVATELVAFVDSDCVVPPGWHARLAAHLDDPAVAAVAPRVLPSRGGSGPTSVLERYLAVRSPLDMGPGEGRVEPGTRVPYVPTAALLVRRADVAGHFDESLRYGEDVDLIWRLVGRGRSVRYEPRVVVEHVEPQTLRALLGRRFRYGTSAAPLAQRHPFAAVPAAARPWPLAIVLLAASGRRTAALVFAGQQSVLLGGRVRRAGVPRRVGARWFGAAVAHTVVSVTRYLALVLPVAAPAGRRHPWLLVLPAVGPGAEWTQRRPRLDPLRWTLLCLADDAAYGAGVWWGCLRARRLRALVPALRSPSAGG